MRLMRMLGGKMNIKNKKKNAAPEFDYDPDALNEDVDAEWVRLMNEKFGINPVDVELKSVKFHDKGIKKQK